MLDRPKFVILPRVDRVVSKRGIQALPVTVDGRELHVDVMEFEIDDFDLILGRDLLENYGANIDCKRKTVTFTPEGETPFVFLGTILISKMPSISSLRSEGMAKSARVTPRASATCFNTA